MVFAIFSKIVFFKIILYQFSLTLVCLKRILLQEIQFMRKEICETAPPPYSFHIRDKTKSDLLAYYACMFSTSHLHIPKFIPLISLQKYNYQPPLPSICGHFCKNTTDYSKCNLVLTHSYFQPSGLGIYVLGEYLFMSLQQYTQTSYNFLFFLFSYFSSF